MGAWPIAVLAIETLMQKIASSCFDMGVKTETKQHGDATDFIDMPFQTQAIEQGSKL